MDIDCQKVIRVLGRLCNWEQKVPVPDDQKLAFALKSEGLSENLSLLCMEELIKNRHISKDKAGYKLTDKGYDYGYKKRHEPID